MSLFLQSLSDVSQATFDAAVQLATQMVAERHPDVDLRRGPFYDLVLYIASELAAVNQDNLDRLRRSSSLQAVNADPTLVDDSTLDYLASNYGVVRTTGTEASGAVVIVLSSLTSVIVPAGQVFTDPSGQSFVSTDAFTARTSSGDVVAPTDKLLVAVGDGTYSFTITVTAAAVGAAYNDVRGMTLTPNATLSTVFVRAYVAADFTGGSDAETNASLAARIATSWTCRSTGSRSGLENLLRSVSGYADMLAVSVTGYGDAEQLRNHSIFPVSLPGRVDAWVKSSTTGAYSVVSLTKTATYQGPGMTGTLWKFSLGRDEAPGLYELEKIQTAANIESPISGYGVTVDARGYDISTGDTDGLTFLPDVISATEAAYSRYSTAQITFNDTDTPTGSLVVNVSTKTYAVLVRLAPGLDVLQDAVCARSSRSLSGDCLLRGAVPVFTSVTLNIGLPTGTSLSDDQGQAVVSAVVDAVNGTSFVGALSSAAVLSALQTVLPTGSAVTSFSLSGRMRRPDGTDVTLGPSSSSLTPTTDTANYVSARTVGFFCRANDVTLTSSSL